MSMLDADGDDGGLKRWGIEEGDICGRGYRRLKIIKRLIIDGNIMMLEHVALMDFGVVQALSRLRKFKDRQNPWS